MVGSNALSSSLTDDLADVNLTLDGLDEPHALLIRTDRPLAIVTDTSSITRSDQNDTDASRSTGENEPIDKHKTRLSRTARQRRIYRKTQKIGTRRTAAPAKEKERLEASRSPSFHFWRSVAHRQLEERRLAEAEQRQLNAAVNTQTTYIDILSNIAHTEVMTVVGQNGFSSLGSSYCSKTIEVAIYDACIRELNTNYARADEVLATCVFGEVKTNITVRSELKRDSDGQLEYLQRLTKEFQSFSLYETGCFLWDATTLQNSITSATKTSRTLKIHERIVFTWEFISEGQGIASGTYQEDMG
ncbi:hypothetical protein ON010_g17140 [Phytophthora cinnamomi]|nr:hypothetical protein ON010_g17140 [Phytophthora cinnamomi]